MKSLLKNSSLAFVLQLSGKLFAYLFSLTITQVLGATAWGIFTICFTILNFTVMIGVLGFNSAITRIFSQKNNNNLNIIANSYKRFIPPIFFINLITTFIIYIYAEYLATTIFHKPYLIPYIKISAFGIIPFIFIYINSSILISIKKFKLFSFLRFTSIYLFAFLVFHIVILISINNPIAPILSFIIALITTSLISFYYVYKYILKKYNDTSKKYISFKAIFKISFPLMLSSSMIFIMGWIDNFMLGVMVSDKELGLYNICSRLAVLMLFALEAISNISAPKISEIYSSGNINQLKNYTQKTAIFSILVSIPSFLVLFIFPEFILNLFGKEFTYAVTTLRILLIGKVIFSFAGPVNLMMSMTKYEKAAKNIIFFSTILNIVLNYFLINKYGISGAAIATSISYFTWKAISLYFVKKKFGFYSGFNPFIFLKKFKKNTSS